jgi:hypothetical protein
MCLARVEVAVPELPTIQWAPLLRQIAEAGLIRRHSVRLLAADHMLKSLEPYRDLLTTMGRTLEEDQAFFLAACAAARLALDPDAGLQWAR